MKGLIRAATARQFLGHLQTVNEATWHRSCPGRRRGAGEPQAAVVHSVARL
jgi:hypothetical protein